MTIGWMKDSVCNGYRAKFDPLCSECYAEDFFVLLLEKTIEISIIFLYNYHSKG